MTSATEVLRRMLDERGVEYDVRDGKAIKNTYWDDAEGRRWGYTSDESGAIKDRQLFLIRGRMDFTPEQAIAATLGETPTPPPPTPPKQPPYDELIESLRRDWDIDVSWDGLRRFWSIELTESGCLMRDRACNAEAENAKLRELVRDMYACIGALCSMVENSPGCSMCPTNQDEERPCASADVYCRMCELGVDA